MPLSFRQPMTINRDYYLKQAADLRRLAEQSSNESYKREMLRLADKWEAMAQPAAK